MTKFESCILNNNTVNIICKCIQNVQFRNLTASRSAYVNNIKVVQRTELFWYIEILAFFRYCNTACTSGTLSNIQSVVSSLIYSLAVLWSNHKWHQWSYVISQTLCFDCNDFIVLFCQGWQMCQHNRTLSDFVLHAIFLGKVAIDLMTKA